ncbi:MFS transporter [Nocardia seriolae]|uniref:MFS transporter n=1 Tax=Nocardia seriolae TaxID=37332 RepID=UPI003AAF76E5
MRAGGRPARAAAGAAVVTVFAKFRGFDPAARLLMINQFGINLGFYMLMPYLAGYLSGTLSLAAWAVGLVLGVRNFSQQGMFLVGGTLADRLGYKPLIVAGCLLRTAGFGMLVAVDSLPGVLIASAATGFAGALFNPAVRAYLAADAGERRVEAFAVFNVFYQAGIMAGPLVGLALLALDFRVTAGAAAVVFAVLTVAQLFALPSRRAATAAEPTSVLDDWRTVVSNRRFVVFALAMVGSYVLSFQVYLALPLQADHIAGDRAQTVTAALFVISGVVAVAGQLRITAWFRSRWGTGLSLVVGMSLLAASFLPPAIVPETRPFGAAAAITALLTAAALLAVGTAAVFPFEMDTVVSLSGNCLVATHYGFYNTVVGVGILIGNLATGAVVGAARAAGIGWAVWLGLTVIGAVAAYGLHRLDRSTPQSVPEVKVERELLPAAGRHRMPTDERVLAGSSLIPASEITDRFRIPFVDPDEQTIPIPRISEPAPGCRRTPSGRY